MTTLNTTPSHIPQPVPHADQVAQAQANEARAKEAARRGIPDEFLPQHLKVQEEIKSLLPINLVVEHERKPGFVKLSTIDLAKELGALLLLIETENGVASCYTTAPAGGRLDPVDPSGKQYALEFEVLAEDHPEGSQGSEFRRLTRLHLQAVGGKLLITETKRGVSVCFAPSPV